jgi:magnesium-transporting ATPase (P-type)
MYEINRIHNVVFLCLLVFPTILLNALAIVTIQRTPQLRKKVCYFVILVQSVVDLGVGSIAVPILTYFLLVPFLNVDVCLPMILVRATSFLCTGLSILTLSAMTMERYLGVVHPFFHMRHVTKKRILIFIASGAFILLSLIAASIFNQGKVIKHTAIGILAVFFVFITYIYTRIYLVVRKNMSHSKVSPEDSGWNLRRFLRETKRARSCFFVVASFVLLIIPYTMSPVFVQFGKMIWNAYFWWSVSLLILISSTNSVIFFWRDGLLRKEALKIAASTFKLRQKSNIDM